MTKHAIKTERREQILQAALTCFSKKGYHLTTMDDIVAESGLSKGSLYWHFKNKKDLLLSIMDWYLTQLEERLGTALETAPTATEKLKALAEMAVQLFSTPQLDLLAAVLIDFFAETRHDDEVSATLQAVVLPYIDYVANIIETGITAGEFRAVNARQLAGSLMAALDGMYLYQTMLTQEVDWAEATRLLMDTLLAGLQVRLE